MQIEVHDGHPLEEYITAIDEHLSDNSVLRAIGERIGIYIPEEEDAAVYLIIKLQEYLKNEHNVNLTKKIMHMTPTQYDKYLTSISPTHLSNRKLPYEKFYPLYANRLLNLIEL